MAKDEQLWSDTSWQATLHHGRHGQRRHLLGLLVAAAEAAEQGPPDAEPNVARKLANRLSSCGRHPIIYQGEVTGRLHVARAMCKSRMCPTCGMFRAKRLAKRLEVYNRTMDAPRLLTLTLKDSSAPLKEQIDRLVRCWRNVRQSAAGKDHVLGGYQCVEVTYNARSDSWHPHLHVVYEGRWWAQSAIADLWEKATGDSRIVDIRAAHGRAAVARYVAKYVAKSQIADQVPVKRIEEWCTALRGLRMVQTFGSLHGMPIEELPAEEREKMVYVAPLRALADEAELGDEDAQHLLQQLHLSLNITEDEEKGIGSGVKMLILGGMIRDWWLEKMSPKIPVKHTGREVSRLLWSEHEEV
jgi:hypothetical protein